MSFKDGYYEGVANGYHDIIKVHVQITEGKIEKIDYEHKDTPDTGGLAIQHIVEQIIKKQTVNVSRVPGARYSSIGIIEAVKKALAVSTGNLTQSEASQIRRQKTEGEYSVLDSGNMVTKVVASSSSESSEKLRFVGGSLDREVLELILEVLPFEFKVYDQYARLQYFNHLKQLNKSEFKNIGMHVVDLHDNEDFYELFEEFRTSESTILNVNDNVKIVKLLNESGTLKGFIEY